MKMKGENFFIENVNFGVLLNMCLLDNIFFDKFRMKLMFEGLICIFVNFYKLLVKRIYLEIL